MANDSLPMRLFAASTTLNAMDFLSSPHFEREHIVLSHSHRIILSYPHPARCFDIRHRRIPHYFSVHITNCGVPILPNVVRTGSILSEAMGICYFFTRTQSRNTALLDAEPEVNVLMFRTGNTGTRPRSSAARDRTCTTPVLPNR